MDVGNCVQYCPINKKNPLTSLCIDCLEENCDEINKTKFVVTRLGPGKYKVKPDR